MESTVYIYALIDPRTDEVRYIGKTDNPKERLKCHIYPPRRNADLYSARWIRGLLDEGIKPKMSILEVTTDAEWREREVFWVEHHRSLGCALTNLTPGGEGGPSGELNSQSRLKSSDVSDIALMFLSGMTSRDIAEKYGVTQVCICNILRGTAWAHAMPAELLTQVEIERKERRRGERHHNAVYTEEIILDLWRHYLAGEEIEEIARTLGMGRSYVWVIIHGKLWAHLHPGTHLVRASRHGHRTSKLTEDGVVSILEQWGRGGLPRLIAQDAGISLSTVHKIVRNESWAGTSRRIDDTRNQARKERSEWTRVNCGKPCKTKQFTLPY